MSSAAERLVTVEHENGRRYQVSEEVYNKKKYAHLGGQTLAESGYNIVSYADGTAYGTDQEPTKWAIDRNVSAPPIGEADEGSGTSVAGEARPAGTPIQEHGEHIASETAMDVHEEDAAEEPHSSRNKGRS